MARERDVDESRARNLIESGSAVGGALTGAALTFVAGPLIGGPLGALAGRAFRRVGLELHERLLGPRQRERAGAAFAWAAEEIHARLETGETLREDGFFGDETSVRPPSDEVLEGALVVAAESYEERKVPYLGRLYASLAFRSEIDPAEAHVFIRLAGRLSYRQLTILAFFDERAETIDLSELDAEREERGFPSLPAGIRPELEELGDLGLLGVVQERGGPVKPSEAYVPANIDRLHLGNFVLLPLGRELHGLMGLVEISEEDKEGIMATFQGSLA